MSDNKLHLKDFIWEHSFGGFLKTKNANHKIFLGSELAKKVGHYTSDIFKILTRKYTPTKMAGIRHLRERIH
jgi:hypothetical protein